MTSPNTDLPDKKDAPAETNGAETSSQPQSRHNSATTPDAPAFGWSAYAERVNGRFAMVGFAMVLLIEALSSDSFLHWSGLVR